MTVTVCAGQSEYSCVELIKAYISDSQLDEATVAAVDGVEKFPYSVIIQSQYALIAQVKKDWSSAVDRLEKLLRIEGDKPSAGTYARLVQACRNAKQFERAEAVAHDGLEFFRDNASIQSEFAWNAQKQGNFSVALERLEKLLALQGVHAVDKTYVRLAQMYRRLGENDKADAILADGIIKFPESIRIKSEYATRSTYETKTNLFGLDVFKDKPIGPVVQQDLLLTTFPGHKSKNVGDNLISYSALKMIVSRNPDFKPIMSFREENLDHYTDGAIRNIIAPGFSVSDGVYPGLYGLYSDLERLPNFFPIGCSFQHTIPSHNTFEKYEYGKDTLAFLRFIATRSGALPCRDQLIVELLHRHEIPAIYSGDLAIYDEEKVNTEFVPPKSIHSVVFTIQHHERYKEQSFRLLSLIKANFPDARLYVAFHSKAGPKPQQIANYAVALGFSELHLYGEVNNLAVYDDIDLHIGYRLHGHISFLRRRKPSVLMVEDARSFGLAHTPGTDVGCFEALSLATMEADQAAPEQALRFVNDQISFAFQDYHRVFSFIDKTYNEFVKPYFDDLSQKTLLP